MDYGVIDRNYSYHCSGHRIVDGQRIKCWKTIGHGPQTFDEGVQHSCNILFMEMALRLGIDRFYEGIHSFKLTEKTGIDMRGEASALVLPQNTVKTVDIARMGFGQAIAMTPLELITAASATINGGTLITPYLLDSVYDAFGNNTYQHNTVLGERVIKENTSNEMRELLAQVVSLGSGKKASVPGYEIGGKTGTAQKYENGVIAQGKYVSTFIGFAPAYDPEYIVLVVVDEPKGGVYYGGLVAAPYAGDIFRNIFEYTNIKPTQSTQVNNFLMPNLKNLSYTQARNIMYKYKLFHEVIGEGDKVINQIPIEGALVTENTVILLELGD